MNRYLAAIWIEVLKLKQIGVDDDFQLGVYSLLATQVISRVRERSRIELPRGIYSIFRPSPDWRPQSRRLLKDPQTISRKR